jgi:hypothetical protein
MDKGERAEELAASAIRAISRHRYSMTSSARDCGDRHGPHDLRERVVSELQRDAGLAAVKARHSGRSRMSAPMLRASVIG